MDTSQAHNLLSHNGNSLRMPLLMGLETVTLTGLLVSGSPLAPTPEWLGAGGPFPEWASVSKKRPVAMRNAG